MSCGERRKTRGALRKDEGGGARCRFQGRLGSGWERKVGNGWLDWGVGAGSERAEESFLGKTREIEEGEGVKTVRRKYKSSLGLWWP